MIGGMIELMNDRRNDRTAAAAPRSEQEEREHSPDDDDDDDDHAFDIVCCLSAHLQSSRAQASLV